MAIFLAIPILGLLVIFQSAVLSQIFLLHGTADLVLLALVAWSVQERVNTAWHWAVVAALLVSLVTALPLAATLLGYLAVTGTALLLRRVFWQRPLFARSLALSPHSHPACDQCHRLGLAPCADRIVQSDHCPAPCQPAGHRCMVFR
jgi:hypothetical protein